MGLGEGSHSFRVRATDAASNTDPSPASHNWRIDLTPPDTVVNSGPSNPTNAVTASFAFTATEAGSTFECALDSGSWGSCTSPKSYSGLGEGNHILRVRATDGVGNTDASPASFDWQVDLTPPDTTLSSGPDSPTNATSASFVFTATEAGSNFECALDGGAYAACVSPKTYSGLSEGSHDFRVRAIDAAGNADTTPAGPHAWVVDTTPPETSISSAPASPIASADASFSIASDEAGSTFQCALDGGSYADCSDPSTYSGLSEGSHNFSVRATDPAGNTDATPATHDWVVDTKPPVVTVPADITVIAADASGSPISDPNIQAFLAAATAMDDNDGDVSSGITHDAPAVFPIDVTTTVTFTVSDAAGNIGSNSATVKVTGVDNVAPNTTSIIINSNAEYAVIADELTVRLRATDNIGVIAYLITEHNATDPLNIVPPYLDPLPSDSGWVPVMETDNLSDTVKYSLGRTYSLGNTVELCAWFKDEQGNISTRVCSSVVFGLFEDFENGVSSWLLSGSDWALIDTDSVSSSHSITESPEGEFLPNANSSLTLAESIDLSSSVSPVLSYWMKLYTPDCNYYSSDRDNAYVEVSSNSGISWTVLQTQNCTNIDSWSNYVLDLSDYVGLKIRIRFRFRADGDAAVGDGWLIDDVSVREQDVGLLSFPFNDDFESGLTNWMLSGSDWALIDTDSVSSSHSITESPEGEFLPNANSSLTLAESIDLSSSVSPVLSYWMKLYTPDCNYYSSDRDNAYVEVSSNSGISWTVLQTQNCTNIDSWSNYVLDLSDYVGLKIRIRFRFRADGDAAVGDGWSIDNVEIH